MQSSKKRVMLLPHTTRWSDARPGHKLIAARRRWVSSPANDARLATEVATFPFWAESAMPFTSRTVAIAYSMQSMLSEAAACTLLRVPS